MAPLPNAVTDALTLLAGCLCTQITADGLPEPCFCGIIPGDGIAAQYAGDCTKKCGMAWVRLSSIVPSSGVGVPNEQVRNCGSGIGFDVEVGMLHCTPVGDAEHLPTQAQLMTASELQVASALTMRTAIACCEGSDDWILGVYQPLGPQGGMLGGAWTVTMWVP